MVGILWGFIGRHEIFRAGSFARPSRQDGTMIGGADCFLSRGNSVCLHCRVASIRKPKPHIKENTVLEPGFAKSPPSQ